MDLGRYDIFGQKEAALEASQNNRRLINIRWWFFLLIFGVAAGTSYITSGYTTRIRDYLAIILLGLVFNALCYLAVRINPKNLFSQQLITVMQLTLDLVLVGILTYAQGGVEARTTVLFMFPILAAALLFRGNVVMLTAALSGATYITALLLHYYINPSPSVNLETLAVPMAFYPAVFLLLGRIALYLEHVKSNRVRESAYNSFLSLVGHQLKHPASATLTIIDAMQHDTTQKLSKESLHYTDLLKTENENQIRLIDNLLESVPQARPIFYEDVDVVALVEKVAERLAAGNERAADLSKHKDSLESVITSGSSVRLGLAFSNIFDNAFRYSKPGDKVTYNVTTKKGRIVVSIRDRGSGMKQEDVVREMKRLSIEGIRGMESSGHLGGLGLGLYASSRIISAHAGELDIHSSEEIGTTVTISLGRKDT